MKLGIDFGTTHTVVMTVDDGNGNTATCNVTLTGDDDTDPSITTCPADRDVSLNGLCQLIVPDLTGDVVATDNCIGIPTVTQLPLAGATLSSGEGTDHTIVMTVDDGNGNTATCNVTLTGDDDTDYLAARVIDTYGG